MPPLVPDLVRELAPVLALVLLLVAGYAHPRPWVEAAVALAAVALALASPLLPLREAERAVVDLLPVVAFLATVLLVAEVCGRAGLFVSAARLLRPRPGARPGGVRLFTVAFGLAAAVTAVLSLDTTVVLLTPVVVAAAVTRGRSSRPGAFACLRMANSASLLFPVSNLTNLLALPALGLTFAGFAAAMALPLAAVLVVEYVVLRLLLRGDLRAPDTPRRSDAAPAPAPGPEPPVPGLAVVPALVVGTMLVGFVVTSPLGLEPYVVSTAAALVLAVWARRRDLVSPAQAVTALRPSFALFVLSLGVVVAAIGAGLLGDLVTEAVTRLVPGGPGTTSFASLLVVAVLATVLANLLTNLSATLLVVPVVAPLGTVAVLAALVGLNVGSGLTLTGSLANLLWRRGLATYDAAPGLREFHRVSLVVTPVSILVAVAVLATVN